jgi:MFS family permease
MLLPFIFIQIPTGRLADRRLGEKEMLSIGFIIMALSTIIMYFINSSSLIIWALILFGTRVGASVVEIMCDVYFFKKVDNCNANLISFYRMARPFAYITAPLIASIVLSFSGFGINYLFLVLGVMMFSGLVFSLSILDTK